MSKKIVITGITTFRNHGVEALVASTIGELRTRLPGYTYTVLDRGSEYDTSRLPDADVTFRHDHTIRPLFAGKLRKAVTTAVPALDRDARAAEREITGAAVVVASGGDVFCSEYGHRSLQSHLQPLRLARRAGVPYLIHAQSIGPFNSAADRSAFVSVARHAAAVTTREGASYRYITQDLGLPAGICHHFADPAFLLTQPPAAEGDALFAIHRADPSRPTVALSTSQAICHWMKSDDQQHVDTWLQVVRWLRDELDANVVLVPHVQEVSPRNDDRVLATRILRELGYPDRVRLAGGDHGASEFKAIISRCDFVVAERMHAALAGLSTGVPTLVIGYSIKAEGILTDLLGAQLTKEKSLISVQNFIAPGSGLAAVKSAWSARKTLATSLAASVPVARAKASAAHDLIASIVR